MAPHRSAGSMERGSPPRFEGFALPTSNTTYCPNQFFDVCLPHRSRGCVRLVAYMLRRVLGWCDENGRPQRERFTITYEQLQRDAGVSRDMIKSALNEAISYRFLRCLQEPRPKRSASAGVSGLYELRWDERSQYLKDPKLFRGFFAGEGNRTYIPNEFFQRVVRHEPLAVAKVVGSVIRFSIGFQTKWGHRRRNAALSYEDIRRYCRIASKQTIAAALAASMQSNYIERVEDGYFDPRGGVSSKTAVYAIKWLNEAAAEPVGRESVPADEGPVDRSEIQAGIGRETVAADRSEKRNGLQIKQRNKTYKQSEGEAAVSFERLRQAGFDSTTAKHLARAYPAVRILDQIEWIDHRPVKFNRLGMLRAAIERDWGPPALPAQPRGSRSEDRGVPAAEALQRVRHRLLGDRPS